MPNFVEQNLAQIQGGSANGESFFGAYLAGQQLRQREREFESQEKTAVLQRETMRTMLQFNRKMNDFKYQDASLKIQRMETLMDASAQLSSIMLQAGNLQNGFANPEIVSRVTEILQRAPELAGENGIGQAVIKEIRIAQQVGQINGQLPLDEVSVGPSGLTQRFRSPNESERLTGFGQLLSERNAALKAGNAEQVALYDAKIQKETLPSGMKLTVGPDGSVVMTQGAVEDNTVATQTRVQEQLMQGQQVFGLAQQLLPIINKDTVGVRGAVNRFVDESVLAQLDPSRKIGDAAEAASVARNLVGSVIRTVRSDSNISEVERKSIENSLPSPESWMESPQSAKIKLAVAVERSARASRQGAQTLGRPVPTMYLLPAEIKARLEVGEITKEQALELLKGNAFIMVEQIRNQVQR